MWLGCIGYVAFLWGMVAISEHALPDPLPASASNRLFSEGRSFPYLQDLVNISYSSVDAGVRQDGNYPIVGRLAFDDTALSTVDYIVAKVCRELTAAYPTLTSSCNTLPGFNPRLWPTHLPVPWNASVMLPDGLTHVAISVTATARAFQQQSGSPVYMSYAELVNVVVGVSSGAHPSLVSSLVVSAHFDSVPYSPGASDNGANVAVLLELFHSLLYKPPTQHAVILLFNEAEECGLFGADAFVNAHRWAQNSKTVINLDSAGGWGPLGMIQLGPRQSWLADVYRDNVPHPYGNSLSADVFGTSVVPSGTDFEVFVRGNIVGVDCVFLRDGYQYHTGLDGLADYAAGTLQHAGDNVRGMMDGILASDYMAGYTASNTKAVWMDIVGTAFVAFDAPMSIGMLFLSMSTSVACGIVLLFIFRDRYPSRRSLGHHLIVPFLLGFSFVLLSLVAAVVLPLVAGAVVGKLNTFAWYSNIPFAVFLFGSWSILGIILVQIGYRSVLLRFESSVGPFVIEATCCLGVATFFLLLHGGLVTANVGSSLLFFWWSIFFVMALVPYLVLAGWTYDPIRVRFFHFRIDPRDIRVWLPFYLIWTLLPLLVTMSTAWRVAVAFTPFMNRFGVTGDTVILDVLYAGLIGVLVAFLLLPVTLAFSHRAQYRWKSAIGVGAIAVIMVVVACAGVSPYTSDRPRRVDVTHFCDLGDGSTTPACTLSLGAPNPGSLSTVVHAMTTSMPFTKGCQALAYKYTTQPALCYDGHVPVFNVTQPTVTVESLLGDSPSAGSVNVSLSITAPAAAVLLLRFSAWSAAGSAASPDATLTAWSLSPTVPPKPSSSWSTYLSTGLQYGLIHRRRSDTFSLWMVFSGQPASLSLDLISSYSANSPLQAQAVKSLPAWARTWGKSNAPGPLAFRITQIVSLPAPFSGSSAALPQDSYQAPLEEKALCRSNDVL
ncbi:hypothetical protein, variant [Capsaspora owczarzaki ATCC 30864]|nr:hypothetical protein, variant [Capsaspora owczarzaki ATCC 30864]